jgi:hypothetical protein
VQDVIDQLALVATLLDDWEGIDLRLASEGDALRARLGAIGKRLAGARSADDIALAIDDLLDVVLETPAEAFVRSLLARASPGDAPAQARRLAAALDPADVASATEATLADGAALGHRLATTSGYTLVPVFFATNRGVDEDVSGADAYGTTLSDSVSFGLANVTIPRSHERGRVETPRWWSLQRPRPDRHVVVDSIERLAGEAFATRLEGESAPASLDLLVFLHGYNVTFEQAARRAAQVAYDLRFPGIVVLFSWPSAGRPHYYAADEDRAFTSGSPGCSGCSPAVRGGTCTCSRTAWAIAC